MLFKIEVRVEKKEITVYEVNIDFCVCKVIPNWDWTVDLRGGTTDSGGWVVQRVLLGRDGTRRGLLARPEYALK